MIDDSALQQLMSLLLSLDGAYAPNTLRAYKADMLEFIAYCEDHNASALPAIPQTVSDFLLQTLGQGIKSSTIRRKISSISAIHRLSCINDPTKHPMVKITERKIFRQLGTRFDQAFPINKQLLERLLDECGTDLRGLRDRALLSVAYDSMRRRSELVSLRIEDIDWLSDKSALILLQKSKTDQQGTGKWIHLSKESASALQRWLSCAQIRSGLIFRGIRPSGHITESLCDSRISRIYKTLAKKSGLDERIVKGISGHSMRVGGAHDLLNTGASMAQIMVKGGWAKTDTVMRYVERVRPTF